MRQKWADRVSIGFLVIYAIVVIVIAAMCGA